MDFTRVSSNSFGASWENPSYFTIVLNPAAYPRCLANDCIVPLVRQDVRTLAYHWPPFFPSNSEDVDEVVRSRLEEVDFLSDLTLFFYFIGALNVVHQRRDPLRAKAGIQSPFTAEFQPLKAKDPLPPFVNSLLLVTWPLPEMIELIANVKLYFRGRRLSAHRVKATIEDFRRAYTGRFDLKYPLVVSLNPTPEEQTMDLPKRMSHLSPTALQAVVDRVNEGVPETPRPTDSSSANGSGFGKGRCKKEEADVKAKLETPTGISQFASGCDFPLHFVAGGDFPPPRARLPLGFFTEQRLDNSVNYVMKMKQIAAAENNRKEAAAMGDISAGGVTEAAASAGGLPEGAGPAGAVLEESASAGGVPEGAVPAGGVSEGASSARVEPADGSMVAPSLNEI